MYVLYVALDLHIVQYCTYVFAVASRLSPSGPSGIVVPSEVSAVIQDRSSTNLSWALAVDSRSVDGYLSYSMDLFGDADEDK